MDKNDKKTVENEAEYTNSGVSGKNQEQCALDQWQGLQGTGLTWFQNAPVFGPKQTRYTSFWPLPKK